MSLKLKIKLDGIRKCSVSGKKASNLFRMLTNMPEIWDAAYVKVQGNSGALTEGVNSDTIDGYSRERSQKIMDSLKSGDYKVSPSRRTYIPKSNGKVRPLGVPTGTDKLVQAACGLILEAIYEPIFSDKSYGFRPDRGCHDALKAVNKKWIGTKWFIEFDIKGCFDNLNHQLLMEKLEAKIDDKRFLALMRRMLEAGYVEEWKYHKTYSGSPQGGVISPILANIYLHDLDVLADQLCEENHKGVHRKIGTEYKKVSKRIVKVREYLDGYRPKEGGKGKPLFSPDITKEELMEELNLLKEQQGNMKCAEEYDPNFRRLSYVRYADDFLFGYIGSKEEAQAIMDKVKGFVEGELKLETSPDKTGIKHHETGARFLGYELRTGTEVKTKVKVKIQGRVVAKRTNSGALIHLYVPEDKARSFVEEGGYGLFKDKNNWRALHRAALINNSDFEIVTQYRRQVRGFCEYYKLARNFYRKLGLVYYIAQISMVKTLAGKHKCRMPSVYKWLNTHEGGEPRLRVREGKYVAEWFKLKEINRKDIRKYDPKADQKYNPAMHFARTEIIERLNANQCEYCGSIGKCEVHHIKKMKDIAKGKERWKVLMIARRRKKLVLCGTCHDLLHAGKLPDNRHKSNIAETV